MLSNSLGHWIGGSSSSTAMEESGLARARKGLNVPQNELVSASLLFILKYFLS